MAAMDWLTWGALGAAAGTVYYLYDKGYLDTILGGTGGGDGEEPQPQPAPGTPPQTIPPVTGTYAYFAKRKKQCRDNHLTMNYLASQGVRLLSYKLYNDGNIYPAVCDAPGPLTIVAVIDVQDASSATILRTLGFTQYFAPPSGPNPSIPIPNPPAGSNLAMTIKHVGESPGHKAYKVYGHYSNHNRGY